MSSLHNINEITLYLTQTLTGYDVIPANFGWHIHQGDTYCGLLEYQGTKGWQGNALNHLSADLKEQIKKFTSVNPSMPKVAA
jgi:hypothetical protein